MERIEHFDDLSVKPTCDLIFAPKTTLSENVLSDCEMVESFSDSKTICDDIFNYCIFNESKALVSKILCNPTHEKRSLFRRQCFLAKLDVNLSKDILKIKEFYNNIKWIYGNKDEEVTRILDTVYFNWPILKLANSNTTLISLKNQYSIFVSPSLGLLSPFLYVIMPYMVLRYKYRIKFPFKQYIRTLYQLSSASIPQHGSMKRMTYFSYMASIFFYIQGLVYSFQNSRQTFDICRLIDKNTKGVVRILNFYEDVKHVLVNNPFFEFNDSSISDDIHTILSSHHPDFSVHRCGKYLHLYKSLLHENIKAKVFDSMRSIFILDALCSIKQFIINKRLNPSSFDFSATQPYVDLVDSWHVSLESESCVKNSFCNLRRRKCHSLITGPNAAGKSTFLKSVLVNVLLSQTIAFTSSKKMISTPFEYIGSSINIPDCKGKESLFEAEMYRCKNNLDFINSNPRKKCILFMDEIFNSTNLVEGISGAYAVLKNIGDSKNCSCLVTTHFPYLTKLSKDSNYRLLQFDCNLSNSSISYDYKIKSGINKQYIALDILESNGFDSKIIKDASAQLKKIIKI